MGSEFDAAYWERRYREGHEHGAGHGHGLGRRPGGGGPNPVLVSETSDLAPGTALEAGCGAGANALWLAAQGWQVTAVDVAEGALDLGREAARSHPPEVASRIDWQQHDLTAWSPPTESFDLVTAHYVHPAGPMADFFARLAAAVAPGGTLLVVGHDPTDPHAVAHGSGDVAWTAGEVAAVLEAGHWDVRVAETRVRHDPATGGAEFRDAVLLARRQVDRPERVGRT